MNSVQQEIAEIRKCTGVDHKLTLAIHRRLQRDRELATDAINLCATKKSRGLTIKEITDILQCDDRSRFIASLLNEDPRVTKEDRPLNPEYPNARTVRFYVVVKRSGIKQVEDT